MPLADYAIHGRPLDDCLVIDVHGHLGHPGRFDAPGTEAADVLAIMDRIGIDTLCASHLLALLGDTADGNDLMAEAVRQFPGRFLAYGVVNPNQPDQIEPELERCRLTLGIGAIKTHIAFHEYPSDGPAYQRVYQYAQTHRMPVLTHSLGSAAQAQAIARAFPDVPFIIAHVGGGYHGRFLDDVVALAGTMPNVYLDLASSLTFAGGLEALVRDVGAEKVLYGSDICFQQATHQIGTVLLADLPDEQKRMILGTNAAKLFGLKAYRELPGGPRLGTQR